MKKAEKKVLVVLGTALVPDTNQENIITIQSYGSVISPFGDTMRDIIIAVYQENVDEIFVVSAKEDSSRMEFLKKIFENSELQGKLKTLNYLFENCMPEFPEGSIRGWLLGGDFSSNGGQNGIDVIRNHPLMPSHVKVTELPINQEVNVFC